MHCCKVIEGQLVSGSKDKTIRMWNSSGNCDRVIDAHNLGVLNISTLRDGRLLTASEDGSVKLWQKGFDKMIQKFDDNGTGSMNCCGGLKDGSVVAGSADGKLRVWV